MAVSELNWKRKEYDTWDDAFRGLAPVVRQQSVRVAAYTQVLYVQACANSFGGKTEEAAERIRGQYADLAYKCGLYHQLGKALVPPEYQTLQRDFTSEELLVYRKYTTDGAQLVAALQERAARTRDKRSGKVSILAAKNIPELMIQESCQQHMERWDGSGYPQGRKGWQISLIAQIVGIAKELDRLASQTKSESPFEDAYAQLIAQSDAQWAPELVQVLVDAKPKCQEVYEKYIYYTMTVPKTIPLVEKRSNRPMGLKFRPMVSNSVGAVAAYEAMPWFSGIADQPEGTDGAGTISEMLRRTDLLAGVSNYFMYEAADALVRMNNCKLRPKVVVLQMMPDFYMLSSQLQGFEKLYKDQPIQRTQLLLTIPEEMVVNASKSRMEVIQRYLRNGVCLLLDDYHPEHLPMDRLKELGFQFVRFAPELYQRQETANAITALRAEGFTVVGKGADTHEILAWLESCGVAYMSGTITGIPVTEEELIRDALLREREESAR